MSVQSNSNESDNTIEAEVSNKHVKIIRSCRVVLKNIDTDKEYKQSNANNTRRSQRQRVPTNKYGEYLEQSGMRHMQTFDSSSEEESDFECDVTPQTSTALFDNDDVEGQDIFKFKARHTKNDLQNKVNEAIQNSPMSPATPKRQLKKSLTKDLVKTPATQKNRRGHTVNSPLNKITEGSPARTPRKCRLSHLATHNSPKTTTPLGTPKNRRLSTLQNNSPFNKVVDTPKDVKEMLKKRIIREMDSDSDFSASDSDFVPEENESESESPSNDSQSSNDDEKVEVLDTRKNSNQVWSRKDIKMKPKQGSDYIIASDDYFMMNSGKKITTSDHTLERLKNLNIDNIESIQSNNAHVSEEHKIKIQELNDYYENMFLRWLFVLNEGYNIVLYGVGSKRSILQKFQIENLQDGPCVVVNGFFPSLTIKNILEAIIIDTLQCSQIPNNITDIVTTIDKELRENDVKLYLIIHNIDGIMLRNGKAQSIMASISEIKNVYMIASFDHINAPLIWDHSKLRKFNFTWWDATTFLPYTDETSYENSLMSQRSGALQLSSLHSVYQSLTSNAKGIFNIIIQNQLDHQKQSHYQGLPFKDLYSRAREQFLVSSDVALRAQLTEFLDHKLVKTKRSSDGGESLLVPIDNVLLQQFLEQQL